MQSDNDNSEQLIRENLAFIHRRIAAACAASGREITAVKLLLATKTVPPEKIKIAIANGETLIGENKIQELKEKDAALAGLKLERHFIGHLQSNKVKDVLRYASCIQSVDRLAIAEALQKRLELESRQLDIMIQVNTSFEESKFGLHPDQVLHFVEAMKQFPLLHITGLMTIGLFDADPEKVRPSFRLLRTLRDEIVDSGLLPAAQCRELSMGMSGDLETAIAEGATIVRVGTAIFGKRSYPDSYYWNEQTA